MGPAIKNVSTPSSEIDDIFTRKAKTTVLQSNQHPSPHPKQKRRKKKSSETQNPEPKRLPPEIVLDPSTQPSHATKAILHDRSVPPKKKRKIVETTVDQDNFRDSRGTGPRRKTDEGFAVYKEDELGINAEAGGTPLCPFDCNCFPQVNGSLNSSGSIEASETATYQWSSEVNV